MKRKYLAGALAAFLGINYFSGVINVSAEDLIQQDAEKLLLYYNFDKVDEEGYVEDSSGNFNNGLLEDEAAVTDGDLTGNCLKLDGNGALKLPDNILKGLETTTISTWVKFSQNSSAMSDWQRIFDFGEDENNNFFLSKNKQVEVKANGKAESTGTSLTFEDDEWIHVAITIGNGAVRLYENGEEISSNLKLSSSLEDFWQATENYIGKSKYEADPKLKADIDEFKIYNTALTSDEIKNIMYADLSDEKLVSIKAEELTISSLDAIYKDINLPTDLGNGVEVQWTSDKDDIIDNTGKVTRPKGNETAVVQLTAKIFKGEAIEEKVFTAMVMPTGVSNYTLSINVDEKLFDISDMLSGVFFEDINHSADGGIYAELIENRSFQFSDPTDEWIFSAETDGTAEVKSDKPLNENNSNYLEVKNSVSLSNDGYKGISVNEGESYDFSIWAKNIEANNNVYVHLEDKEGQVISDVLEIAVKDGEWTKYTGTLKATAGTINGRCVVYTKEKGIVDLDMISLFPKENVNDLGLREDLVEKVADLNPSFIRFPGGCVVEGHTKAQMYNWKNTIGNIEERKEIENMWGYSQSYGLGFYEYFILCEELDAEPVPIVNCGMTCQGGTHNGTSEWMAEIGDELNEYIQDALDLIEYCNGEITTEWGAKRAAAGHPEPFNLKYLGIGNEQWGKDYQVRYEEFQKAINEKYPDIVLIAASGPVAEGVIPNAAWQWISEQDSDAIVDEHYYMSPDWFMQNTDRYDTYDRNGNQVFLGEYASQSNTLRSAIAEAAYFTGLERNSDIVKMSSYAPLFAKIDDYQWSPDMIWFDGNTSYGSVNYYVQKLLSNNIGTQMLKDEFVKPSMEQQDITGGIILGAWSTEVQYDNIKVTDNESGEVLLEDNFNNGLENWTNVNGAWEVEDEQLTLNEMAENCMVLSNKTDMDNYTLELTAKKNAGNEGFLVGFGAKDSENYYWLNMGGWGNTATVVEKAVNGSKSTISTASAEFSTVETAKEYQIKIVVDGANFKCYINGELSNEYTEKVVNTDMYTSSSYDEATGDLIVKVVNTTDTDKELNIKLNGVENIDTTANVEYITAESNTATNSFENPENVVINNKEIDNVSNNFIFEADKNSVNVIRINIAEGNIPENPIDPSEPENPVKENKTPVINASDALLNVGDEFNPLKGVTATDEEDGDLTSKIVVAENTVNTSKVGEYKVIYEVTDSEGLEASKEIKVTVKEKDETSDKGKGDSSSGNSNKNNNSKLPYTGGTAVLGLAILGAGALAVGKKLAKKK